MNLKFKKGTFDFLKRYGRFCTQTPVYIRIKACYKIPCFFIFTSILAARPASAQTQTLSPVADAYVRNGSFGGINYGTDTSLMVKGSTSSGFTRYSYLKFSLTSVTSVSTAVLRIYGKNNESTSAVNVSVYGNNTDSWTEGGITSNNAPASLATSLSSTGVNNVAKYYDLDVTDFVKTQFTGDKTVTLVMKDPANQNRNLIFNSRENAKNKPQLVITNTGGGSPSNALLFVENTDKFPSNERFTFSKIQVPWSRDNIHYNTNRDSVKIRMHNKGISTLTITNLILSNAAAFKIEKLNGATYNAGTAFPLNITSGNFVDLIIRFIAVDAGTRVKVLHENLTIVSNDDKFPSKKILLDGLWQKSGEGVHEPYAQETIDAFGFKTKTGFGATEPDQGDSTKIKGDEIKPSYFVRANTSLPVSVTQMAAYHSCCTSTEKFVWFAKGSTTTNTVFTHIGSDAQRLQPRSSASGNPPAAGTFTSTVPFGFRIGSSNWTDAAKNPGFKIGIRIWKALDPNGNVIPNTYIAGNDYLGTSATNYDYNDNVYYITNVRPEKGAAFFSALKGTPSALDFGEKLLQSNNSLQLSLSSLGQTYSDGSKDPVINISSVTITGENSSEFSAGLPVKTTLNPQENTTFTVNFKPVSQGLKIADLLIYYNNSLSPLRVPLYGIGKSSGTTVTVHQRINCGSSTALTINGKTWKADNQYALDNLEPFTNSSLANKISGTDEDALYTTEQSSNAEKAPFRYEIPIANGSYVVRLHFAEIYWNAVGGSLSGGAGSRVMSVKLENQLRLINFDVTQEVGGATAIIKNLPVTVSDGKLNIDFSATANRPMVMALEVYSFSSSARPANAVDSSVIASSAFETLKVYPNPLHNEFTIQLPSKYTGRPEVEIIDLQGRKYKLNKADLRNSSSYIQVDVSKLLLKPGVYLLRIFDNRGNADIAKLLIQ